MSRKCPVCGAGAYPPDLAVYDALVAALRRIADRDTSMPARFESEHVVSPELAAAMAWDIDKEIASAALAAVGESE